MATFLQGFAQTFNPSQAIMSGMNIADRKRKRELEAKAEQRAEESHNINMETKQLQLDQAKLVKRQQKMKELYGQMSTASKAGNDKAFLGYATKFSNLVNDGRTAIGTMDLANMTEEQKNNFFNSNPSLTPHQDDRYLTRVWNDNTGGTDEYVSFNNQQDLLDWAGSMADPEAVFKRDARQKAQAEDFNASAPIEEVVDAQGNVSFARNQMLRNEEGIYRVKRVALTPDAAAKYDDTAKIKIDAREREIGVAREKEALEMEKGRLGVKKLKADIELTEAKAVQTLQGKTVTPADRVKIAKARQELMMKYLTPLANERGLVVDPDTMQFMTREDKVVSNEDIEKIQAEANLMVRMIESGEAKDFTDAKLSVKTAVKRQALAEELTRLRRMALLQRERRTGQALGYGR